MSQSMSLNAMNETPFQLGRGVCGNLERAVEREWLVTKGMGGYASGTVGDMNTRRYHGLLMAALSPPVGRTLLVAKMDATVRYGGKTTHLSCNAFVDGTVTPHGYLHLETFIYG